jgi:hypothetical protein
MHLCDWLLGYPSALVLIYHTPPQFHLNVPCNHPAHLPHQQSITSSGVLKIAYTFVKRFAGS